MKAEHRILVGIDDPFVELVSRERLERIAGLVLEAEGLPDAELSLVVTDDETIRRLNRDYAGEDAATDVLSFSLREGEEFASPDAVLRLGEVIISYPTAERQAREVGRALDEEIAHLLVHGVLHLLAYDHAEAEEERRMQEREVAILRSVVDGA